MNYEAVFIWRLIVITVIAVTLTVCSCVAHRDYIGTHAVKDMVLEGADPMCAYCAVWGAGENNPEMAIICMECAKGE